MLYPAYQQRQVADAFSAAGCASTYVEIESPHGHDAFLMETEQVGSPVRAFLDALG
jgi:homoserine O-acetyltransferase